MLKGVDCIAIEYVVDDFSPCVNCKTKECGLIDGQECDKQRAFKKFKQDYFICKNEIEVTREYISRNNLEWDLLSFVSRKVK